MKFISLFERSDGKIRKNESYTFDEIKFAIIKNNYRFFNHWWYGFERGKALDVILKTFKDLIDQDKEGKHTIKKKNNLSSKK